MDIRYIKKSTEKISPDNMMNVINDIITKSDLEVIENYDVNKLYNRGDKVYIKKYLTLDKSYEKYLPFLYKIDDNMNKIFEYFIETCRTNNKRGKWYEENCRIQRYRRTI